MEKNLIVETEEVLGLVEDGFVDIVPAADVDLKDKDIQAVIYKLVIKMRARGDYKGIGPLGEGLHNIIMQLIEASPSLARNKVVILRNLLVFIKDEITDTIEAE